MLEEHKRILRMAANDALPKIIDQQSDLPIKIVRELVEENYLDAIVSSDQDGFSCHDPRITFTGREYLHRIQDAQASAEQNMIITLQRLRDIMVSVSTGGQRIQDTNNEYRSLLSSIDQELRQRGIEHNIPFSDLWEWHGRWSSGDLPTYKSRRQFIAELFNPLLRHVQDLQFGRLPRIEEPTGWLKVDRTVTEIRRRIAESKNEEQYQAVGLLCREALISLAQAVHDPEKYESIDEIEFSETDVKRMLDAYYASELSGASNQVARKHARASYDLAVKLQHRRTATFRQAALCVESTISLINMIAIISGRRDPDST